MSGLRISLLMLALLFGGLAHASHPFGNALRASDEELDRMRGGFVVSWNGQEFLVPFSIEGIERLTQINGQTFVNGELVSPKVNPQALTPFTQMGRVSVNVSTQAPIRVDPLATSHDPDLPTTTIETPALAVLEGTPPAGAEGVSPTTTPDVDSGLIASGSGPGNTTIANTQVATHGSLILIQNGSANAIALPPGASLDSLATVIQNSVNDQVIRNITTLNITIAAQALAAQARLNAILNQGVRGLY